MLPPAPPKNVYGRKKDIEILISAINEYNAIGIYGNAGVGKTTMLGMLASHLFKNNQRKICYADCSQKIGLFPVIDLLIREVQILHKLDNIGHEQSELNQALFHLFDLTNRYSSIVFIDNAHHIPLSNLETFLENILLYNYESLFIFSSRTKYPKLKKWDLPAFFEYEIENIKEEAARAWLNKSLHFTNAYETIVSFTHNEKIGNPLFIKLFISHAKEKEQNKTLFQENSFDHVWKFLFDSLSKESQNTLKVIPLIQGKIPLDIFIKATGASDKITEELQSSQLVYTTKKGEIYIHDTFSEFLIQSLSENDLQHLSVYVGKLFFELLHYYSESSDLVSLLYRIHNFIIQNGIKEKNNTSKNLFIDFLSLSLQEELPFDYHKLYRLYTHYFSDNLSIFESILWKELTSMKFEKGKSFAKFLLTDNSSQDQITCIQFCDAVFCYLEDPEKEEKQNELEKLTSKYIDNLSHSKNLTKILQTLFFLDHVYILYGKVFDNLVYSRSDLLKKITKDISFEKISLYEQILLSWLMYYYVQDADKIQIIRFFHSITPQKISSLPSIQMELELFELVSRFLYGQTQYKKALEFSKTYYEKAQLHGLHSRILQAWYLHIRIQEELLHYQDIISLLNQVKGIIQNDAKSSSFIYDTNVRIKLLRMKFGLYPTKKELHDWKQQADSEQRLIQSFFLTLPMIQYHYFTGNFDDFIKAYRLIFKKYKSVSPSAKHFPFNSFVQGLLYFHTYKGIPNIIRKLKNISKPILRQTYITRLLEVKYYMLSENFHLAHNYLSGILNDLSDNYTAQLYFEAKELEFQLLWKQRKIAACKNTFSFLQQKWEDSENIHLASKLSFYQSLIAHTEQYYELSKKLLEDGLFLAHANENIYLTAFYIKALLYLFSADLMETSQKTLTLDLQKILLDTSQSLDSAIQKEIDWFIPSKKERIKKSNEDHKQIKESIEYVTLSINKNIRTITFSKTNQTLDFQRKEKIFDLLILLIENDYKTVAINGCFEKIWKIPYLPQYHSNNIYVAIQRLRSLLGREYHDLIITSHDGYRISKKYQFEFITERKSVRINQRQRDFLVRKNSITKNDYAKKYEISESLAYYDLQDLIKLGKVKSQKRGRNVFYIFENESN